MSNENKYSKISRRSFLKGAMAAGGALALAGCQPETVTNTVTVPNTVTVTEQITKTVVETITQTETVMGTMPESKHIYVNPDHCSGCATCEMICSTRHFGQANINLSAIRVHSNLLKRSFTGYACQQCLSASCAAACPDKIKAISFDEKTGARYIDMDKCTLCGVCIEACPFAEDIYPPIFITSAGDEDYIIKCDLCHGYNEGPACIEYCPSAAITLV